MDKIENIALTKLLKLELPEFVYKVIGIIEKRDPASLKLEHVLALLQEQYEKTNQLKPPYGRHALSATIDSLHKKRLKYVAAISREMHTCRNLEVEEMKDFVNITYPLVRDNLHYLRQNNRSVINSMITNFFIQINKDAEVQKAFEKLGFYRYIDVLRKTQDELYDLTMLRDIELSQRPKGATPAIKKEAQYVLRAVFEQINLFQFSFKDIDYSQLIAELNTLIARYNGLINTRASRNVTRKKKSAAKLEQQKNEASKENVLARETSSWNVSEKAEAVIEPSNLKVSSITNNENDVKVVKPQIFRDVYHQPDRKDG